MVAVHAFCATNVAIRVVHRLLPFLAVCVYSAAHRAFRVLDCYIEPVNFQVSFLVVTRFLLRLARSSFRFCFCICNRSLHGIFFFRNFADRNNSVFGSSSVIPVALMGLASVCRIVKSTVFI